MNVLIVQKTVENIYRLQNYVEESSPGSSIMGTLSLSEAEAYIKSSKSDVDICFIEVTAEDPRGMMLAQSLKEARTNVILNSDTRKYALDAWQLGVKDYILGTVSLESLQHAFKSCTFY